MREYNPSEILANLGTGIYLIDSDMNLLWVNTEIEQWFGGIEISKPTHKCYNALFARELPCNNCPALRLSDASNLEVSNIQWSTISGHKRQYRFQAKNNPDDTLLVMVMDITDQYETQRIREDFIATLTHDLRTPLLAELRTLELLTAGSFGTLNDKQTEVLQAMLVSNRELLAMVKNLLEVYRYEAGAKVLSLENFDIVCLIEDCVFELSALAETKNIMLKANLPEVIPLVKADRREIWRVLTNLIGNAIEYTEEKGAINVKLSLKQTEILVEVEDNGRGIPEEDINNLFKRFSQGTSENISSGTGLGLYLSKQIIQAHNGKIWAKSESGRGSKFFFTLPAGL